MANGDPMQDPNVRRLVGMAQAGAPPNYRLRYKHFALWDTRRYTTAGTTLTAGDHNFFRNPQGSQTADGFTTKTYAETNLEKAGSLPDEVNCLVDRISVEIFPNGLFAATVVPANYKDLTALMRQGVVYFESGDYKAYLGPLTMFPAGGGPLVWTDGSNATAVSASANNGVPAPSAERQLVEPIAIRGGQSFKFVMFVGAAITLADGTNGLDVRVRLGGRQVVRAVDG